MGKDKIDEKQNDNLNENELNGDLNQEDESAQTSEESTDKVKSEEKISGLEKQIEQLKDSLLRKAAEFENYKRRTENDQLNLIKYAAEPFLKKLLPIVDDLERSLAHMTEETDVNKVKEGIQLIYNKFMKTLDEQGVKKIEAIGNPFDVEYHEALMQKPDDSVPIHTVLEELEPGYIYKDRVLRHTKVIVSEKTSSE